MLLNIIISVLIFLVVFGISNFVFIKRKIDYFQGYPILLLFYFFSSVIIVIFYNHIIFDYFRGININIFLIPLITLIISIMIYPVLNQKLKIPSDFLKKHDKVFFLKMDYRMITTKFSDVIFQDFILLILTLFFIDMGLNTLSISILFLIVFPLLHIPLIFVHKGLMSLYYICLSLLSVAVPYLILNIEYGLIYVIIFHWLTYLVGRFCFGLYLKMCRPAS